MASNYWSSSQYNDWMVNNETMKDKNMIDKLKLGYDTYDKLEIVSINLINKLGKRLMTRQRVILTACTYLKRFYIKNNYLETDLALIISTSLYLSSKVEELPIHIKTVINESNKFYKTLNYPINLTVQSIGEMEFNLIEDLNCNLIVFHPNIQQFNLPDSVLQLSYYMLNDLYKTNLILLYQPYLLTISIITFALNSQNQQLYLQDFLKALNVDLSLISIIVKDLFKFYRIYNGLNDSVILKLYLNNHL